MADEADLRFGEQEVDEAAGQRLLLGRKKPEDGGQAPNIVPERAAARFYVRSAFAPGLEKLKARVTACFETP